jgi:phage terminase large subunit-like protein
VNAAALPLPPKPSSISAPPATRSDADWLACAPPTLQESFLQSLDDAALRALPWLFEVWAMPHQLPPAGDWRAWVCLGGRGAGKTRAGAEWVRGRAEGARPRDPGACRRIALIGETYDQARDIMVMGESGILAVSPPDRRPVWQASHRRLVWPNGAEAQCFSATDPEALRGPQFDAAWADELGKWTQAQAAWDQLQFALRLGTRPQVAVTTTPRNQPVLRALLARPSTVVTHAPTRANRAWLAPGFLAEIEARYGGTRLGRQELDGELIEEVEGGLFPRAVMDRVRLPSAPPLGRVVVAVDPSAGGGDLCGIVAVGAQTEGPPGEWRAVVLEDASLHAALPGDWARAVVALARRHGAERVVAEVNQGGDMVAATLRMVDPLLRVTQVRATRSKAERALPVATLYEQGRVRHLPGLAALEDQLSRMTASGYAGTGSPDRVDALVWAVHALMIEPAAGWVEPRVRTV